MDDIIKSTNNLVSNIKNSEAYKKYCLAREKIDKDAGLSDKLNKFKIAQFNYQTKILRGESVNFDEEKYVCSLYSELVLNEILKEFIESESLLMKYLNKVHEIINTSVEVVEIKNMAYSKNCLGLFYKI